MTPKPERPVPLRDSRQSDPFGFTVVTIGVLAIVVFTCLWVGILQG